MITTIKTANNGGCGTCACPCHTDVEEPGPHIATCKFADDDYVPPDFREAAAEAAKGIQREVTKYVRDNDRGPS
jgi:hypothetical protein